MDKIDDLRIQIDKIDDEIMSLLDKRFNLTKEIGELKKQSNREVLDTKRENNIRNKISKYSHSPSISVVYTAIMDESKRQQGK